MNINRIVYYFLFLAVAMGGFASMAQNNYGLDLIGYSSFAFGLIMVFDLIKAKNDWDKRIELSALIITTALFGMRALYIHLPYIEWVVTINSGILAVIYLVKIRLAYSKISTNRKFAAFVMAYYTGLVLLLLSMSIRIFSPLISDGLGGLGFGLLLIFGLGFYLLKKDLMDGEDITLLKYIRKTNPNSLVLATAFFLISAYTGLYMVKILPPLYTEKVPPTYLELVHKAETGQEKAIDGSYQHDHYKEAYDAFVEKNKNK